MIQWTGSRKSELNVIGGGTGKMIEMCRVRHLLVVVYLVRFWGFIYFFIGYLVSIYLTSTM